MLAVLGEESEAVVDCLTGRGVDDRLSKHLDRAAVDFVDAEDGAGHFTASGADQTGQANDLSLTDIEGDVLQYGGAVQMLHLEGNFAERDFFLWELLGQLATD